MVKKSYEAQKKSERSIIKIYYIFKQLIFMAMTWNPNTGVFLQEIQHYIHHHISDGDMSVVSFSSFGSILIVLHLWDFSTTYRSSHWHFWPHFGFTIPIFCIRKKPMPNIQLHPEVFSSLLRTSKIAVIVSKDLSLVSPSIVKLDQLCLIYKSTNLVTIVFL